MLYYVYAIKELVKNYIFVGLTTIGERRINQHNNGQNRKAYIPLSF